MEKDKVGKTEKSGKTKTKVVKDKEKADKNGNSTPKEKSSREKVKEVKDKAALSILKDNNKDKDSKKDAEKGKKLNKSHNNGKKSHKKSIDSDAIDVTQGQAAIPGDHKESISEKPNRRSGISSRTHEKSLPGGHLLPAPSITNINKVTPNKNPQPSSEKLNREMEKNVAEAVEDFWTTAWGICSDRFDQGNGPISVSLELRDTWLRILEVLWMDVDPSVGKRIILPKKVFTPDDPPLPLQFDSWSRGALQVFPDHQGNESILDPFIRDEDKRASITLPKSPEIKATPTKVVEIALTPSVPTDIKNPTPPQLPQDDATKEKLWNKFFFSVTENHLKPKKSVAKSTQILRKVAESQKIKRKVSIEKSPAKSSEFRQSFKNTNSNEPKTNETIHIMEKDEDHLEFRNNSSGTDPPQTMETEPPKTVETDTDYYESDYTPKPEDVLNVLYGPGQNPPRVASSMIEMSKSWDTILEAKIMTSKSSMEVNDAYKRLGVKPWSPMDCGGRKGSGVFRLYNESTTEVIRRTNPDYMPKKRLRGAVGVFGDGDEKPVEMSVVDRIIDPDDADAVDSMVDILIYSETSEFTTLRPASFDLAEDDFYPLRSVGSEDPDGFHNMNQRTNPKNPEYNIQRTASLPINENHQKRLLTKEEQDFVTKKAQTYNAKFQRQQQIKGFEMAKKLEESLVQEINLDQYLHPGLSLEKVPHIHPHPHHKPLDKSETTKVIADNLKTKHANTEEHGVKSSALNFVSPTETDKKRMVLKRHSKFVSDRKGHPGPLVPEDFKNRTSPIHSSESKEEGVEFSITEEHQVKVAFK